jgi:hypothetical protein
MHVMTKCSTVAVLCLAASPLLGQTQPSTTQPAEEESRETVVVIVQPDDAAPATKPSRAATRSTSGPSTKPLTRIEKFGKAKLGRSAPAALAALSAPDDPKADEVAKFQRAVQAGRWDEVARTLDSFDRKDDQKKLYKQLVQQLSSADTTGGGGDGPQNGSSETRSGRIIRSSGGGATIVMGPSGPMPGGPGGGGGGSGGPYLLPQDLIAVLRMAPADFDDDLIEPLGQLVSLALSKASVIEPIVETLDKGIRNLGGSDEANRYRAAQVLASAGRDLESGQFLPPLKAPLGDNNPKLLDLTAKHLMAKAGDADRDDREPLRLRAWQVTQAQLTHPKADPKQRDAAVARALELFPQLPKDKTEAWFKEGLSKEQQGVAVLSNVNASLQQAFQNRDSSQREKGLKQQKQLIENLLADGGGDAHRWAPALNVLAIQWVFEADYTRNRPTQRDQMRQRNTMYGPYYEGPPPQINNGNEPQPLDPQVLLDSAPPDAWLALLDPALATRVRAAVAQMQLKGDSPLDALPIIESLAKQHPKLANDLADSLISALSRVWDPNQNSYNRYRSYVYYGPYGYSQDSGNGIPLTRSAQIRNLAELSATLKTLSALPIEPVRDSGVVGAFTNAHSAAEVFRIEDIETVFGPAGQIQRDTLVELAQSMRQRLATSWRSPQVQQQAKTKRTDKELDAEVTRGYTLLSKMLEDRISKEPDWKLMTVLGSTLYDWAEYDYGKQVDLAIYTARRDKAFGIFKAAAEKYQAKLPELRDSEQTPFVHEQWFNAALGASDLAALTRQATPAQSQIDQIRQSLLAIQPKPLAEKHMTAFAKWLGDAPNTIKPELKHRFLKAGLQVAGDHPAAEPARKLVQYYADLLTEVELHAGVDGDPTIGHTNPFGLHLAIRHTQAVGRESGGFNKYLTNQQSRSGYYYSGPPGQGPVNYRDDFEKKLRGALADRFEIQSVTWYDEKVESRPFGKPGWRETPIAYVLMKPKDASVDKIPAIPIDMDFQDKTGTVILPVTTQVLLIDSRPDNAPPRPVDHIEVTQILDQRDAANGKLTLDIKATAKGLLPDLAGLLDVNVPGFKVDKTDENALTVTAMDAEGDALRPVSERSWLIHLSAADGSRGGAMFKFPQPKAKDIKVAYKRYADADVADVDPQVAVAGLPLRSTRTWIGWTIALVALAAVGLLAWWKRRRKHVADDQPQHAYAVPQHVSPFTVIDLLKRIETDPVLGLSEAQRQQLTNEILHLQEKFFSPKPNGEAAPDLSAVAAKWVGTARQRG